MGKSIRGGRRRRRTGRNWWRTSAMEKAGGGGGWRGGIVDWMVTRCGKIATVGSHVPRIHVLPRTGNTVQSQISRMSFPLSLPLHPSIDRQRAPFDTRLPRLMERCRLMLCTFRSCFIGFRDAITLQLEKELCRNYVKKCIYIYIHTRFINLRKLLVKLFR